ncbi:MAG: peptidylprolyl isomerase [Deltaproteobacteria bacterium]|nr:peptidylprolyl isomerase [Deltaproteobacteria bacterium]
MDRGLTTKQRIGTMVHGLRSTVPLLFLLACTTPKPASPVVALVNGETVTLAAFERFVELERWKFGEMAAPPKDKILDDFIKGRLLLAEARKMDIQATPGEVKEKIGAFKDHYPGPGDFERLLAARGWTVEDFEKRQAEELAIQKLVEAITAGAVQVSGAEVQAYYKNQGSEFDHSEQLLARQIVTDSREKATALREMLLKGASFEETARKYSLSPDRKNGGSLGWFGRGVMPKEFDDICFYLKVGQLSPVIKTPYGHHLFQVLERRPAGRFSFDEVKDEIEGKLKAQKGREAFQAWFEKLRSEAKIKVYASTLQKLP